MEPKIKAAYIDTGKVKFELRHFPYVGADSVRGAEAAACAQAQGKFWAFHDRLFHNQGRTQLQPDTLAAHAEAVGLDKAKFSACLADKTYSQAISDQFKAARDQGITGTPTFLVNGQKVVGYRSYETWVQLIDAALAAKK